MKRKIILFISLFTFLSSCSNNVTNKLESNSHKEIEVSNKINSTQENSNISKTDSNLSETNYASNVFPVSSDPELGALMAMFKIPKQIPLNKELKLDVYLGHFSGFEEIYRAYIYKLVLVYGKSQLSLDYNYNYNYKIIDEIPDFYTEKYNVKHEDNTIIFNQFIEVTIDENILQLENNECGFIKFSIYMYNSQGVEVSSSLGIGYEYTTAYFINDGDNIKFDGWWRNFIK